MAEVVVVGAGLGGMAAAARLAKQGHSVTVCERNSQVGGAIRAIEQDGFRWDAGPTSTTLPAVLRDLFRKSGRPIERYLDLELRAPARRHVFEDSSLVDLPTGSRLAQIDAVNAGLGSGAGPLWADFVDQQSELWNTLRTQVLDDPDGGSRLADRSVARALRSRLSLARLLKQSFKDERLRTMAGHPFVLTGSELKDVPAFGAVESYVERSFGVWRVAGGMARLAAALATRLDERGVRLLLDCPVSEITSADGRVTGVRTHNATTLPADQVVTDIDPRTVFQDLLEHPGLAGARREFARSTPAIPLAVTHLGIQGDVPNLPDEVVYHGEPLLVLQTQGEAPPGHHAWTLLRRGSAQEDVLVTLVRRGLDVRDQVVSRLDRSPVDLIAETGGSSYGLAWAGWRQAVARASFGNPMPGLHCLGASMHPGSGIPYVAWGAAHVAARIGSRARRGG